MTQFLEINPNFPSDVRERLEYLNSADGIASLDAKVKQVQGRIGPACREQLIAQAFKSSTATKRILWLRKEADVVNEAATPVSACRKGCSHCCNIGVTILESEAKVIGREIGRAPVSPPVGKFLMTGDFASEEDYVAKSESMAAEFFGVKCPFLDANSKCSIYASRPLACRQQFNLDEDELLCQLQPGMSIPVPYLNATNQRLAYLMVNGLHMKMADIRYFFPER